MDLIGQLAGTLGIEEEQAAALAGAVMGKVQGAVADEAGDDAAAELGQAVPELSGWQATAQQKLSDDGGGLLGGLGGGLLGAAAGALGGESAQDTAAIVMLLGKLNIDAGKATLVAPLVLDFLKDRLNPSLLSTVLKAAPLLSGEGGDTAEAGGGLADAAGMLGGLLGKK